MDKSIFQSEAIQKAVQAIFDYFDHCIYFSELQGEIFDASIKVLEQFQDVENCDGDRRPYTLVVESRNMLDLLRPFAEAIGQNDQAYNETARKNLAKRVEGYRKMAMAQAGK